LVEGKERAKRGQREGKDRLTSLNPLFAPSIPPLKTLDTVDEWQ